jgi:hypothetical protein
MTRRQYGHAEGAAIAVSNRKTVREFFDQAAIGIQFTKEAGNATGKGSGKKESPDWAWDVQDLHLKVSTGISPSI